MNKQVIVEMLEQHLTEKGLPAAEVGRVLGYSPAMISQVRKGNWENISHEFWLKLSAYLNYRSEWQLADIANYKRVVNTCSYAQDYCRAKCISYEPGTGKSASLKQFVRQTKNAYYVECEEHWRGKDFVKALSRAVGIEPEGTRTVIIENIIDKLKGKDKPLIIIDEFDKLTDSDAQIFKSLYNKLEDICGFVLCGTPFLKKRITRGKDKDKQGYKEIFSRLGGEFVTLKPITNADIHAIAIANGITDKSVHAQIVAEYKGVSGEKYGDLRTLKEIIMKIVALNAK